MLHGPLAEIDGVVRVVRGPAVGGPVVPGLEPHVRNQVKVISDSYCKYFLLVVHTVQVSVVGKSCLPLFCYFSTTYLMFSSRHLFIVQGETS